MNKKNENINNIEEIIKDELLKLSKNLEEKFGVKFDDFSQSFIVQPFYRNLKLSIILKYFNLDIKDFFQD